MITARSRRKRFLYFIGFTIVFLCVAPVVLLYSIGYGVNGFSLFKTGGLYVYSAENGVTVYVNDVSVGETSTFQRGVLVKGLKPNTYDVRVSKDGFGEWKKTIVVEDQKVAIAYPFLVHTNIDPVLVPEKISAVQGSTTIANPQYAAVVALFASTTTKATTSIEVSKVSLSKEHGSDLIAEWVGTEENTPFYFCLGSTSAERLCAGRLLVYSLPDLGTIDFLPGRNDIVLFVAGNKLYITELDKRLPQNITLLYQPASKTTPIDFRFLDSETLIVREQGKYKIIKI